MTQTTTATQGSGAAQLADQFENQVMAAIASMEKMRATDQELGFERFEDELRQAQKEAIIIHDVRSKFFDRLHKYHGLPVPVWSQVLEGYKDALRESEITPIHSRDEFPTELWTMIEIAPGVVRHLWDAKHWHEEATDIPYSGDFGITEILAHPWWSEHCDKQTTRKKSKEKVSKVKARKLVEENLVQLVHRERIVGIVVLSIIRHAWERDAKAHKATAGLMPPLSVVTWSNQQRRMAEEIDVIVWQTEVEGKRVEVRTKESFRCINVGGQELDLNKTQAAIVQCLHLNFGPKLSGCDRDDLLSAIKPEDEAHWPERWRPLDSFKNNKRAYALLIEKGGSPGTWKLRAVRDQPAQQA